MLKCLLASFIIVTTNLCATYIVFAADENLPQTFDSQPTNDLNATNLLPNSTYESIFPDVHFREVIMEETGASSSTDIVTQEELNRITDIYANFCNIRSIQGAEYLNNLVDLNISVNSITDISPLAHLNALTSLNLQGNFELSDISALQYLTNLEYLDLGQNMVTNISALAGLTKLKTLNIEGNQIVDISFLQNMHDLEILFIGDNKISDISVFKNLTQLTDLSMHTNKITDLSAIKTLTNLIDLNFAANQVTNLSALRNMEDLLYLDFSENGVSSLSDIKNSTNLKQLFAVSNELTDVTTLTNFSHLTYLDLGSNHIRDISPLKNIFDAGCSLKLAYQTINLSNTEINQNKVTLPASKTIAYDFYKEPLTENIPYPSDTYSFTNGNHTWDTSTSIPDKVSITYKKSYPNFVYSVTFLTKPAVDTNAPIISGTDIRIVAGHPPLTISEYEELANIHTDDGSELTITGLNQVDWNTVGTYEVTVSSTDPNGNNASPLTLKITIIPNTSFEETTKNSTPPTTSQKPVPVPSTSPLPKTGDKSPQKIQLIGLLITTLSGLILIRKNK